MEVDFDSLSEDDVLAVLVRLARSYKAHFRRTLPITGEIGELYACHRFKLVREPPGTSGFDARDADGKRVQIKSRAPSRLAGAVNRSGRINRFHNWGFDYALLTLLDGDYEVDGIWRAERRCLEEAQEQVKNDRAGIHVSTFIKIGEQAWGEDTSL